MKKLTKIFFLSLISLSIVSCSNEPKQIEIKADDQTDQVEKTELLAENKAEVDMKVEGMTCAMGCAKFIEEKVAGLNGVVVSAVDFAEGKAHFEYDKTTLTSEEIEEYINNIHEGQYKASIADADSDKTEEVEDNDTEEGKESLSSVSGKIPNISFPELFTYFLRRLR